MSVENELKKGTGGKHTMAKGTNPVGAWISFEYPVTSVTLGADTDMIDFQLTKI